AFCECPAAHGGHVHPELMIVEIVDDNGQKVPDGKPGEVVVTPLGVEGFPLVRFRTGDVARLHTGTCSCDWQTPRLGPIEGRLDQRLKCKGTTIYPEMIFQAAQKIRSVKAVYIEVRSAFDLSDEVKVVVGTDDRELTSRKLGDLLQARLRVRPEIEIRDHHEVIVDMEKAGGRKLKNFFDFRKGT
ncbi:MAG: phenylacetate--CoA ligase family protein, partial [Desulfobulbaceae bacterium]|nr:phenylacetate--CoA ligase family protein [Desulfobulbaceae bacterium]